MVCECGKPLEDGQAYVIGPKNLCWDCFESKTRAASSQPPVNYRAASGATRSESAPAYHLIPGPGHRRVAVRFGIGAKQHGPRNWQKGGADFIAECLNHMQEHLSKWLAGDKSDDHLAAAAWGCYALMHFETEQPAELREAMGWPEERA